LAANSSFQLEANGLRMTPNGPNSRGVVSLKAGSTVEVAVLAGSFGVTNGHGVLLASVRPGQTISFAMQAGGVPTSFSGTGMVSYENGHYYLTSDVNVKYELTCKDFKKYVGTKVVIISGIVQAPAAAGAASTICVRSLEINGATGMSTTTKLIIDGVVVAAGGGIGVGIYEASQSSTPASR